MVLADFLRWPVSNRPIARQKGRVVRPWQGRLEGSHVSGGA